MANARQFMAARTAIWSGNMSDPTIKQLLNNELEELVIPASFSGNRFPLFFNSWATRLKRITQEGYPGDASYILNVYTTQQLALPNIEEVIMRMQIGYCNAKRKLRIAHGISITANNYDFYQCGIDAPSTDIYAHEESSDSILGKIKSFWEKHIVFHGNDGNRVVYDPVSAAWVIEPDV